MSLTPCKDTQQNPIFQQQDIVPIRRRSGRQFRVGSIRVESDSSRNKNEVVPLNYSHFIKFSAYHLAKLRYVTCDLKS